MARFGVAASLVMVGAALLVRSHSGFPVPISRRPVVQATDTPDPNITPGPYPTYGDYPTEASTSTPLVNTGTDTPFAPPPIRDEPLPTLPAGTEIYPTAPIVGTSSPPYGP